MSNGVLRPRVLFLLALGVSRAQQPTPDAPMVTFRDQTGLVLLSFHVAHGKTYVPDLKPADVALLEDGKPREFTIFDSPASQGRMPLELVLLFDANPRINYFWDPVAVFRFIPEWTEEMSREILTKETADIRVSVYRCSGQTLYPMIRATTDVRQLTDTLRGLLNPEWRGFGRGGKAIDLSLPAERATVARGPFTNDYPTSPFVSQEQRGWPMEAAIGTLNEMAAAQDKVARVMVMFSEGIGATTTIPEDIGNQALDLGIPIYPVATNYLGQIDSSYPRNLYRMGEFKALGKMTGGREVEYMQINAATLGKILGDFKNHGLSEYVVGFVPPRVSGPPRQHRLEIKLASKSSGRLEGGRRRASY
jgi:hypothetical protein